MAKKIVTDLQVEGKKVLVRVDFNVPLKDGVITDDNRIVQALPTIKYLIDHNAKVILFSHLGKVKSEEDKAKLSLRPVAERLSELLGKPVTFVPETRGEKLEAAINALNEGDVLLFENTRFEDLDGKIDELFNVFDGKIIKSVRVSSKVTDGSINVQPFSIIGKCTFSLNSKRQYIGYIDFCDKDDNNKDNVGLYMIEVCTCSREELPEEFAWEGVNNGKPGIFIHYID